MCPSIHDAIVSDLVEKTVSEITGARSLEWITVKIDSALSVLKDRALSDEDLMVLARSFLGALPKDVFYGWLLSVDLDRLSRDPRFKGGIGSFRELLEEFRREAEASDYKPLGFASEAEAGEAEAEATVEVGVEQPEQEAATIPVKVGEEGGRKVALIAALAVAAAAVAVVIWFLFMK